MKRLPPSQIIAEYRAAITRTMGGEQCDLTYERGWFVFRAGDIIVERLRGAQLIYMTAQLNERAKAKG